jgi:hypothetical protein
MTKEDLDKMVKFKKFMENNNASKRLPSVV